VPTNNTGVPGTGSLDGVFNNAAVTTSPAGSANRYIDGSTSPVDDRLTALRTLRQSAGALAGPDRVLWASIVWTMNGSNYGRQVGFVLGSDGLRNRSQNVSTNTSWGGSGAGNAIGVGGAINTLAVTPTIWNGGNKVVSTTTGAKNLATNQDNIVILKFVFADGTNPDTVSAWGFGETETITEAAFNASAISAQAVVDQDTLNILSFGQSQVAIETIDEIRLGDTFADVTTGLPEPPQPLEVTAISYEPAGEQITLTWKSNPGENYGLYWSTDLLDFANNIDPAIPAADPGIRTTWGPFASPVPGAPRLFFQVGPADLADPTLEQTYGSASSITLVFSERMHAATATDPANYAVTKDGGGTVALGSASLSPDGKTVTLTTTAPLEFASSYTVTMTGLKDPAGRLVGNPTVANFQTWDNNPAGVKVFILAGQSNMVGHGKAEEGVGNVAGAIGSLRYLAINDNGNYGKLLVDPGNPATSAWKTRSDVKVWWRDSDITAARAVIKGDLKIGYSEGRNTTWFGPEYAFGWAVGDHYTEPVLLIKTSWGGKSLHVDFRPPSAVAARGGVVGPYYSGMIEYVRDCLTNLATEFPEFAGMGYQIAGFGWHQGWNDRVDATNSANYEANLVDLIHDLRAEFGRPDLPVSIGTTGMDPQPTYTQVELAQLAVADPARHPEFTGTVFTADTRPFWRDSTVSPSNFGYHWNHNGESHFLIGGAMGQGVVSLLNP
jgi:hypothetical protein